MKVGLKLGLVFASNKDKFGKAHEVSWTSEIYEVVRPVGPNSFLVDVPPGEIKVWPLHSLQVFKKAHRTASPAGPVVDKAVVRAQRMEARNISDAEVKETLEAPARSRRERAPMIPRDFPP